MRALTQTLRDQMTLLRDLLHRAPLELVTKIGFSHLGFAGSKLEKKVSTNLEAIHIGKSVRDSAVKQLHECQRCLEPSQTVSVSNIGETNYLAKPANHGFGFASAFPTKLVCC